MQLLGVKNNMQQNSSRTCCAHGSSISSLDSMVTEVSLGLAAAGKASSHKEAAGVSQCWAAPTSVGHCFCGAGDLQSSYAPDVLPQLTTPLSHSL